MISTYESNCSVKENKCWHCKKEIPTGKQEIAYSVMAGSYYKLSVRIRFHKKCFEEIAGYEYMFENY